MKIKYRHRFYIYLFGLLSLFFTAIIMMFFLNKEKTLKTKLIESHQLIYAKTLSDYIVKNQLDSASMRKLSNIAPLFPENIHLTVLNKEGHVLYDNRVPFCEKSENQAHEIEVEKALLSGNGWNTKGFMNTKLCFLYYAVRQENCIIRVGLPYTPEMAAFQKPEVSSIGFTVFLFILVVLSLSFILIYFKQSINDLMYFVLSFRNNKKVPDNFFIRDSELNEIQSKIVEIFEQLESSKQNILPETEKLLQHFHFEEEGISFFTPSFENIYTNSHFIQHLNVLLNQPTFDVKNLFKSPVFSEITHFLENPGKKNTFGKKIYANGCHFFVQAVIFDDKSFEIIIRDISESEKNDFDKTVMTTNIAHELRTPVTSVCAYLETLMEHKNLSPEKRDDYIQRAYLQIMRLSDIIQDVTLLTKTKEAPQNFTLEDVNIYEMLQELIEINAKSFIEKNKSVVNLLVRKDIAVMGNHTLLYSIFRNLLNNALKYAGEKSIITIHNYMEDNEYYYFSFSDNGKGVEEKHIGSIFERFYRIAEGRTRDKGGYGLGLSIVKEAVNFHQGEIIAKNRAEGGLEFLFTIRKSCV